MSAALAEIEPVEVQPDDGSELLRIPLHAVEQVCPMAEYFSETFNVGKAINRVGVGFQQSPPKLDELDAS